MLGTDANTGQPLSGIAHLQQSVRDILTTPIGSRVMRRTYGSGLFALTDAPLNMSTKMDMYAATVKALQQWEPRIQVQQVSASMTTDGQVSLTITGLYLPDGTPVTIPGVVIN
jgi:phage baseplate assembly protein W